MPRNGSGSYNLPQAPFVPNTTINSAAMNADLSDIAQALTQSVAADGQTPLTGSLEASGVGTAAAPSYSFTGTPGSGIYPAGGGNVGVAVNGSSVATFGPTGVVGATSFPVGAITDFAGNTAPPLWLLCFGQPLDRTIYSLLFTAIGTTYGGAGTTFNLPDCRGRTVFGRDDMGGATAGRITAGGGNFNGTVLGGVGGGQNQILTTQQMPSHAHGITEPNGGIGHQHFMPGLVGSAQNITIITGGPNINFVTGGFSTNTNFSTTGIAINANGGGASHPIVNPSIIFNKIIFAGA